MLSKAPIYEVDVCLFFWGTYFSLGDNPYLVPSQACCSLGVKMISLNRNETLRTGWIKSSVFPSKKEVKSGYLWNSCGAREVTYKDRPPGTWHPTAHDTNHKKVHHDLLGPHFGWMPWSRVYFGGKNYC